MFKESSGKYYQNNKERLQKVLVKEIKAFFRKKKKKSDNMVGNNAQISAWEISISRKFHFPISELRKFLPEI